MQIFNRNFVTTRTAIPILFCFLFIFSSGCSKKEEKEIKIGAILPLTGEVSVYGIKMKKGIDLAAKQWNSKGGINGKPLNILYEDDQADPKMSVSAVQKLISTEKISVIIGGAISATALPIIPIIDKSKVVLFSPAATSPKLGGSSPYFFRNWPSDIYDGSAMGQFAANTLAIKRVAILNVNNEWGIGISRVFGEIFKKNGGEIVISDSYEQNATDFRAQLAKIKNQQVEAIFIPGYLKELINILRQKKELGIKSPILSAYGFYDPKILELAQDAAEGAIFTTPTYDPDKKDPAIENYVAIFQKEYGEKPDIWSAQAYDAMNIIAVALERKQQAGTELRNEIARIRNFEGVAGRTSFDENGEVQKPLKFMIVKNGKFMDFNSKEQ